MSKRQKLMGRWFNNGISIRFRPNGTVLYNSRATGLVEGQYHYDPQYQPISQAKAVKNLTVWLPRPGKTLVLEFELRYLGESEIQLRRIPKPRKSRQPLDFSETMAVILSRAPSDDKDSDQLAETEPIASANSSRETEN